MLSKVKQAPVSKVDGIDLSVVEGTCIKCANHVEYSAIVGKQPEPMFVKMPNGECVPYCKSKCHPLLIPKHSRITKFVGGIAHIATLGIPRISQWLNLGQDLQIPMRSALSARVLQVPMVAL